MIRKLLKSDLAKTAGIYTFSKFLNSAIPFILLAVLTRYLTTEEYGQLSMFNATVSFLVPFVGMSIGAAIGRKLIEGNEAESKEYVFNCLLIVAAATAAVSLFMLIFSSQISRYTTVPVSLLPHVIITASSSCLLGAVLTFYQLKDRVKTFAFLQNSCTVLNVVLSLVFVVALRMKLPGRVYGITYSNLIFAIIAMILFCKYTKGNHNRINKAYIKDEIFNFALPLIPTDIKATVLTYMDRIFLTNMVNVATTGVYSLGNQISLPLLFFEQAFNLAFMPWLFKNLEQNNEAQKRKIVKMTYLYFVVVPLIAILWSLMAGPVIDIITDGGYEDAHIYVIWLSLGYAFTGMHMMVVNYISYAKKLNLYAVVTILVMILNIVLNYVLIKKDGPAGAAEATFICNVVSFLLTWALVIKIYPMPWFEVFKKDKKG